MGRGTKAQILGLAGRALPTVGEKNSPPTVDVTGPDGVVLSLDQVATSLISFNACQMIAECVYQRFKQGDPDPATEAEAADEVDLEPDKEENETPSE